MKRGRIIVNNTDYTGSFVTPNPSGTPTATLSSIQINGVIYAIEGGGGSSEHYAPYNLTVGISGTSKFEETEDRRIKNIKEV